jgi:hypothetical protein
MRGIIMGTIESMLYEIGVRIAALPQPCETTGINGAPSFDTDLPVNIGFLPLDTHRRLIHEENSAVRQLVAGQFVKDVGTLLCKKHELFVEAVRQLMDVPEEIGLLSSFDGQEAHLLEATQAWYTYAASDRLFPQTIEQQISIRCATPRPDFQERSMKAFETMAYAYEDLRLGFSTVAYLATYSPLAISAVEDAERSLRQAFGEPVAFQWNGFDAIPADIYLAIRLVGRDKRATDRAARGKDINDPIEITLAEEEGVVVTMNGPVRGLPWNGLQNIIGADRPGPNALRRILARRDGSLEIATCHGPDSYHFNTLTGETIQRVGGCGDLGRHKSLYTLHV